MNNATPEFTGRPLSAIMPLPKTAGHWFWVGLWGEFSLPLSAEAIDHLIADGWQQVPVGSSFAETQLYETISLVNEEKHKMIPFYRPDQDDREPIPVILGFTIESLNHRISEINETQAIHMLNPYPLPQYGEIAYIPADSTGQEMLNYSIMQLPLVARQRWSELGDKLRNISAPLLWPAFTKLHAIASNEDLYQQNIQSLRARQQLAIGKTQSDLIVVEAQLKAAHIHIAELRQALKKDWRPLWHEIRITARDLARDYYHYHLSLHPIEIETSQEAPAEDAVTKIQPEKETFMQSALPFVDQVPETPAEKPVRVKKERRPAQAPSKIIATRQDYIHTRADQVGFQIGKALLTRDNFKDYPEAKISRHLHSFGKERGEITIDIGDGTEAWPTINDALNTLGDGVRDVYMATLAMGIEENGIQHICEPFLVNPDEILEVCCKEKSNGSYTPAQRAEVIKNLKTLSLCKVRAVIPVPAAQTGQKKRGRPRRGEIRQGDKTVVVIQGALVDLLSFKIGEYNTITGEELWEKQSIAIGQWAKTTPGLTPSTAIMMRKILGYSGKNERYQKRIGEYLSLMFRYNAQRGGMFPSGISVKALLEGAGILITKDVRKKPGRFKDAIENAIKDLQNDGVIGKHWEIVDATPAGKEIDQEVKEQAYGWFDLWLNKKLNFQPPNEVKEQYQKLLKPANEAPAGK